MRLQRLFKKEEISWAALVLEVFSVTLSVLVALAIGDWNEERQQRKNVEQALRGIAAECASNRRTLEARLSYYLAVREGIQRRLEQEGPAAPAFPLKEWNGLKPVLLRDASYRTAIATDVFSHMDFALADAIAQTYSFHEFYRYFYDKTVDFIFTPGSNPSLGTLGSRMDEMIDITRETLSLDSQLSEKIQKRIGRP